jgi:chromate transporter
MNRREPTPDAHAAGAGSRTSVPEIAGLFLRLGTVAFGGPAAHIAMMEDEVVRRRGWMTREQFLDYLGATNLIPGPNSTEMAIHIGHLRGGWPGLVVAGASFIIPAAVLVTVAAWAYVRYGSLPQVLGLLYGIKPVVIAIIMQALWGLGRSALKDATLVLVGLLSIVAITVGVHELLVLGLAAAAVVLLRSWQRPAGGRPASVAMAACIAAGGGGSMVSGVAAGSAAAAPFALWSLFLTFAKIGAVLFGSGYVLLAFLRADLVERLGWINEPQLLDAVAIGQVTPGPVFTTATFIGYLLGGATGAAVATLGIFLPAFVFVAISGPLVPRLRRSVLASAALDGVNVASLALMAVVSWQLGRAALIDPLTVAMAALSLLALARYRTGSAWLILAGALIGWIGRG